MALQKNKREICKDKQILMISRFYKPAFVTIIFLRTYYKRKRRGNARKKLKQLVSLRHCVFPIMTEKRQSMQKKRLYKSMRSIKHSWKRVVQSTKFLSEKTNEDGSIVIEIKKQYNSSPVGEYLN